MACRGETTIEDRRRRPRNPRARIAATRAPSRPSPPSRPPRPPALASTSRPDDRPTRDRPGVAGRAWGPLRRARADRGRQVAHRL